LEASSDGLTKARGQRHLELALFSPGGPTKARGQRHLELALFSPGTI
jgi:hypothetical protein